MKVCIHQKVVEDFLKNMETSSTVEIVIGKEKEDLFKIAKARGILAKGSRDLGLFKTIWGFTNKANNNGAILPEKDLLKVLPQIVGKPVSRNHTRNLVIGNYIDYKYIQKSKQIIAYGVFYKSNFPKMWEEAKKLHKSGKLSSSFEIWAPKSARKNMSDGNYELHQMEIAGGALVFEDENEKPAFEDANVLALAKDLQNETPELIYAIKHSEDEIIKANTWEDSIKQNIQKRETEKQMENDSINNNVLKNITCQNCKETFETSEQTNIKCNKCFSILKSDGEMLYPPQLQDYNIGCPECNSKNWLIMSNKDNNSELRCQSCSKEYLIEFSKEEPMEGLGKLSFLYIGNVGCPQCNKNIEITGTSSSPIHDMNCTKCGLKFKVNTEKINKKRQIESISEIIPEAKEKEVEMEEEIKEEPKLEETEIKVEDKKPFTPDELKEKPKSEEKVIEVPVKSTEDNVETPEQPNEEIVATVETVESTEEVQSQEESSETESPKEEVKDEAIEEVIETSEELTKAERKTSNLKKLIKRHKSNAIKYRSRLNKAVEKIVELKKSKQLAKATLEKATEDEITKIKNDADSKIEFYKANAKIMVERSVELGEYAAELSDEDLVNDDVFEKAKLTKENAILRASKESADDNVGSKSTKSNEYYKAKQDEINNTAFGHVNKQGE